MTTKPTKSDGVKILRIIPSPGDAEAKIRIVPDPPKREK
jgi:hypothetical protein